MEGVAAAEVVRVREENWEELSSGFPVRIGFRDCGDKKTSRFKMGDRADLLVSLPKGYQSGDLLHVNLPPAMAWVHGGGKVQRFTVDFEGQSEIRIPVITTSNVVGRQHFAVCVRNMFEEERAASPGLLTIQGAN
jgi:hypothetical protein